jgi:hypothetical protein
MSIDLELDLKYKLVWSRIELAEDMVHCRAVLKVAMKYLEPKKA